MPEIQAPPNAPHDNKRGSIIIVSSIFIVLATLAVIGRFIGRKLKNLYYGWDDWTILIAMGFLWAQYIMAVVPSDYLGYHIWDISPPSKLVTTQKILFANNLVYICANPIIKISLLLLYKRIFVQRAFHIVLYAFGAVLLVWMVGMLFVGIFGCHPVHAFWDPEAGHCVPFKNHASAYAAVNILTDIIVWILPLPMIWRLNLRGVQKLLISSIFALGLFVWAASIARLATSVVHLQDPDQTYYLANGLTWSTVEPCVAVICACLPTQKIVFLRMIPNSWRTSNTSGKAILDSHRKVNPTKATSRSSRWQKWGMPTSNLDSFPLQSLDPRDVHSYNMAVSTDGTTHEIPLPNGIHVQKETSVVDTPKADV